ncbi:MAG: TolC family protein, partial [Xanthomonadales bacterium]|nr:TolC family protein [Xanthomonadales bacterium]
MALTAALALAGLLLSAPSRAAEEHEETSLTPDSQLSLPELLETTLERHPRSGVILAAENTARAEAAYGRNWLPESPELSGFHLSDRPFDDIGAFENEVALSLPLWLPGEKRAQTALGEAATSAYQSSRAEFRWRTSAVLREQLWSLARAGRSWELALEQEQRMEDVLEQTLSKLKEAFPTPDVIYWVLPVLQSG